MRRLLAVLGLAALGLTACTGHTSATPRTVVTLGDSVPAGTACGCSPFPALYAAAQHATDVDLARPGWRARDVRAAVPGEQSALSTASEVVIMIGANDMGNDFADASRYPAVASGVEADVTATVSAIERIHRVPVVLLGYWNVVLDGKVGAAQYGDAGVRSAARATDVVNAALKAAAARTGAVYVPTAPAFHGDDGERDPTGLLAADGDHPDAAGHAAIAALIPPLRRR